MAKATQKDKPSQKQKEEKKEIDNNKVTKSREKKPNSARAKEKTSVKQSGSDVFIGMGKQNVIDMFAQKTGDTGSPEVQVALASHKIVNLSQHLTGNPKDNHSRRGLLKIISKRRRILNYLAGIDKTRYQNLVLKVGLKR